MKKSFFLLLTVSLLMLIPAAALGINSPVVSEKHGVITGIFISDLELSVGAEFGFTRDLGVSVRLWEDTEKIGVKYEFNPNMALVGGVFESEPYLGVNGALDINRDLLGLYEVDLYMIDGDFNILYELGAKFNLTKSLDLRGGLLGFAGGDEDDVHFELGVGYKF